MVDPHCLGLFSLVSVPSLICTDSSFQSVPFIFLNHNSSALSSQTLPVLSPLFLDLFSFPPSYYPFQFLKPSTISTCNSHSSWVLSFPSCSLFKSVQALPVLTTTSIAADTVTHHTSLSYESISLDVWSLYQLFQFWLLYLLSSYFYLL